MFFSSIKEINRYVKHLLLRKTGILKTSILLERRFEEMHQIWRAKKHKVYWGKRLFCHYPLQLSFMYTIVSEISFNLFWSGDKRLLSESLRRWGWFHRHNERFPNTLAKNLKFKKVRRGFVDKRTMITTALTSCCHWKIFVPFCLQKKIPENTFLTLTVNYPKIIQKNKLYHSKQH